MAKKNKNAKSTGKAKKEEETKVEDETTTDEVVEDETTTDEVVEDEVEETEEKDEEESEDEADEDTDSEEEVDSEEESEDEADEDTDSEEEVDSEVETEDATGEVTRYGVYKGTNLVAVYNVVNHGSDFIKLAKARAKKIDGVAKPYVDPKQPVVEKTVVNIVNASGSLVRQFAKSTHGKDYEKLAADFVEKYGVKRGLRVRE